MSNRILTCIICPRGCTLNVALGDKNEVISVSGNACKRGAEYAENECTNPKRTVTTTMRCDNGDRVPVKTDVSIPKTDVFECMRLINAATAKLPVKTGDVLLENICGSNIVATDNRK